MRETESLGVVSRFRVVDAVEDMIVVGLIGTERFACPVGYEQGEEIEVRAHVCCENRVVQMRG
jgi:hypothetical protein